MMYRFIALMCLVCSTAVSYGQTTGMVFSPIVKGGASAVDYRATYDPDGDALAQRFHYQNGVTDSLRLRLLFLFKQDNQESLYFDSLGGEAQWQFIKEKDYGWDSALRLGLQIPTQDNEPFRFGAAWTGLVNLDSQWQLRANAIMVREFGPQHDPGVIPQARGEVTRKLSKHFSLSLDWFSQFKHTEDLGEFEEQGHSIGPLFKTKIIKGLGANIGALFGLTDAARRVQYRFIINYGW